MSTAPQPIKSEEEQPQTLKINNNSNNQQEDITNQQLKQTSKKQQQQKDATASPKDSEGKTNISRGILGVATNPERGTYVTEGTITDVVNAPSIFPNKNGRVNPITEKDLKARIDDERERGGLNKEHQEQLAIRMRLEMQGEEYTPPKGFEKYADLAATKKEFQKKEPSADQKKGEQLISIEDDATAEEQKGPQ